jgi:hypothetical protein
VSTFDEWQDETITVQLADELKPIKGRLVEHNTRGLVLALKLHRTHEEGIFAGITEHGEALYFAPWQRIRAIATPAQLTNVS